MRQLHGNEIGPAGLGTTFTHRDKREVMMGAVEVVREWKRPLDSTRNPLRITGAWPGTHPLRPMRYWPFGDRKRNVIACRSDTASGVVSGRR